MPSFNLLTVDGNPKVSKGASVGVLTGVLHLLPATRYDELRVAQGLPRLGVNLCPFAGTCAAPCLNTAGRGGIPQASFAGRAFVNNVEQGRYRRTHEYMTDRATFLARLIGELGKLAAYAQSLGMQPAARLNGTSDIHWAARHPEVVRAAQRLGVRLYDYTKRPVRYVENAPIHYTYSLDVGAAREAHALQYLAAGGNVAVVFRGGLPETWNGFPVVDGDVTDVRYLDPRGVVVGLKAKGKAKTDTSGFVRDARPSSEPMTIGEWYNYTREWSE
jgi:hypothetical protein